ncbi:dolichol-phosphate mannosyltransferase subunit 3-like [Mya arenaria]|uniref:dolichol-phosphate mannosyltransferase subunit 3-like n=1 Tax=Mya arenaria TaxID=6604 RepID=UPI0022DFFB1B|nr:dolichol-phosphate mannosyltransferase subunit 3-like [Mya arenaria]
MIPKLFQWLMAGGAFLALWISLLLGYIDSDINDSTKDVILFLPVFVIVAFALYSVAVIGYRVATFNDCVQSAEELQNDITEAKKDLMAKGFNFD